MPGGRPALLCACANLDACCAGRWGGRPIRDWADLLQPRLRGRLAMVDSPRELVAIALATLGLPLNASAADVEAAGCGAGGLRARVDELRQQVRLSCTHRAGPETLNTHRVADVGAGGLRACVDELRQQVRGCHAHSMQGPKP